MDMKCYVRVGPVYVHYPELLVALKDHINEGEPGRFSNHDAELLIRLGKRIKEGNDQLEAQARAIQTPVTVNR